MEKHQIKWAVLAAVALLVVVTAFSAVSFYSDCVAAEAGLKAQRQEAMNRYSRMRTEIIEVAGVNERYRHDVLAAFDRVVAARQGSPNEVMRAISEANPAIDPSTYDRVMRTITERRAEFTDTQSTLIDRRREYDTFRQQPPGAAWNLLFRFPRIDLDETARIVVTDETRDAFRTGRDTPLALPGN